MSFRYAITEPVNVIAPMNTSTKISISKTVPLFFCATYVAKPTSTAAIPTKLCSSATSSGIAVIATLAAMLRPIAAPTTSAGSSSQYRSTSLCVSVANTAIDIPMMPYSTPARAVSRQERPRRQRMKKMPAAR